MAWLTVKPAVKFFHIKILLVPTADRRHAGRIEYRVKEQKTRLRVPQACRIIEVWTAGIEPAPLS